VPPICRAFTRSPRPVKIGLNLLGVVGSTFGLLVFFDRFERDSVQEWLACAATALMLPPVVGMAASLNAKTVRGLLKEFETLYVLTLGLCAFGLACMFFRERPAKILCLILGAPNVAITSFGDAVHECDRVVSSRVWFSLVVANLLVFLAMYVLQLADLKDYTFHVLSFPVAATTLFCTVASTGITFAAKNIGLSVLRPGSLVTLVSDICCVLLDSETLALLKAAYSLLGQAYGDFTANSTVTSSLRNYRKYRNSILGSELIPAPAGGANAVAPQAGRVPVDPGPVLD
jgi:hypothetical protein